MKQSADKEGVVVFIPVRGGSKSIPLKNIKPINGRPLVYWTIAAAQACEEVDTIIISTDSEEIEQVVLAFGCSKVKIHHRSAANASDTASTEAVMLEYLEQSELLPQDLFLLVQATSPLLKPEDISRGIELLRDANYDSFLSCVRIKRFFWSDDGVPINYDVFQRPRRQDFAGTLVENGAVYGSSVARIKNSGNRISGKIGIVEMTENSFHEIDEPVDWLIVEHLLAQKQ